MIYAGAHGGQRQNERRPGTRPRTPLLMIRRRRSLLFFPGADAARTTSPIHLQTFSIFVPPRTND